MPNIKSIKCPKCTSLETKRHRKRSKKFQYYCPKCNLFFTENSKHNRLKHSKDFEEFVTMYLNKSRTIEKVNLNELLLHFSNLSKTSIYARKYVFETYAFLIKLFKTYEMYKAKLFKDDDFTISLLTDSKKVVNLIVNVKIKSGDISHVYLSIKEPLNLNRIYEKTNFANLIQQSSNGSLLFKLEVANLKDQLTTIFRPFKTQFSNIFPDC